jgi:hypothetical protein
MIMANLPPSRNRFAPGEQIGNLIVLPDAFDSASGDVAAAAKLICAAYFANDEGAPERWTDAAMRLAALPAINLDDVAVKLLHSLFEIAPSRHGDRLAADVDGIPCDTIWALIAGALADIQAAAPGVENPKLTDAFFAFRSAFAELHADEHSDGEEQYRIMDPADVVMRDEPAFTASGVVMKLKRSFLALVGQDWSDDAVLDERPARFEAGLQTSDIYEQMFWSAIVDLERLAEPVTFRKFATDAATWEAALAHYRGVWSLWDELGEDYTNEESDAVCAVAMPALETLIETPAPDLHALAIKIEEMRRDQREIQDENIDAILADVRRFAASNATQQSPRTSNTAPAWERAKAEYLAAKAALDAYDDGVPGNDDKEADRLTDVRSAAEDALMAIPSPDAAAFAFKHIVAHGEGRETNCWNTMLSNEAQRFAQGGY